MTSDFRYNIFKFNTLSDKLSPINVTGIPPKER